MTTLRLSVCCLLSAVCWMLPAATAHAQTANGSFTVTYETMATGGGTVGGGNPMQAVTIIGEPIGGGTLNGTFTVRGGAQSGPNTYSTSTKTITVGGTIDDPAASVVVNGVSASVTGTTFQAAGVTLLEGANTITVTAADLAGNQSSSSLMVHYLPHPPARPTVATTPPAISATSHTLTGTKTPGTSIWINGVEAVPLNDSTTWSATVRNLVEGDNVFVIVTKDLAGNESASNTVTIVVDNLPPVIGAISAPAKTNSTPVTITGTVDDSLTTVNANGVAATRAGLTFEAALPLSIGLNTVTITATSPNGYISTKTLSVTLGTMPTVTAIQPPNGTKLYAGTAVTVQATATDAENDPLECQILLDGVIVVNWFTNASHPWTPGNANLGLHTLEVRARDGFGGYGSATSQLYILRRPVSHP